MSRFSPAAVMRTIRNQKAKLRLDASLHPVVPDRERAGDGFFALEAAEHALRNRGKFAKNTCLTVLGQLIRPDLPVGGTHTLLFLRQTIGAIQLDDEDDVLPRTVVLAKLQNIMTTMPELDQAKARRTLDRLRRLPESVTEIHFKHLWATTK